MRPTPIKPISLVGVVVFADLEFFVQVGLKRGFYVFDLAFGDQAVRDKAVGIKLQRSFLLLDCAIHLRLRKHGLVTLVMAETTVAEDVQNHVFVEFLPEFRGNFGGMNHSFGVVAVHVENRCFNHHRDVGWIR